MSSTSTRLAALALSAVTFAAPAASSDFWLIDVTRAPEGRAAILATYDNAGECFGASLAHPLAVCVPLTESAQCAQAEYMAHEYGLIDGDF